MTTERNELNSISAICETTLYAEANDFLALGWKVLETCSAFTYEMNLEYREIEKVSEFRYSLGWFGDVNDLEYPDSYLSRTSPF